MRRDSRVVHSIRLEGIRVKTLRKLRTIKFEVVEFLFIDFISNVTIDGNGGAEHQDVIEFPPNCWIEVFQDRLRARIPVGAFRAALMDSGLRINLSTQMSHPVSSSHLHIL